jgi:hypothetical protein
MARASFNLLWPLILWNTMDFMETPHHSMVFFMITSPSMSSAKRMSVSIYVIEYLDVVVKHTFTSSVSGL